MKNFDPAEKSSFIVYLDANNLYGWAMSKPLPVGEFEWMSEDELKDWKDLWRKKELVAFWKLIWNILRNCMIFTMIFLWLLRG